MHRFFIDTATERISSLTAGSTVNLPTRIAHQVYKVLHLLPGEQLALLDNSGDEIICVITICTRASVEVRVQERRAGKQESPVRLILYQGLLKSARFEWILEKGTELGISTFVPLLCRRSTAGLEETGSSKWQRWQRIIQEATEQCGRAHVPELMPVCSLTQAVQNLPEGALALIPWEEERHVSLRRALQAALPEQVQPLKTVLLFIGPEGGFEAEEVRLAQQHGVQLVTLGPRILRAETAALTAVANVMYELEERLRQ
ncbi:MAG TPA: 16S rRNA (uracil(1498)-N(3))-methyltransferase [Ktedonobacteraceae bacterium]|jgi:16S rRNA (uracil1498-N3)-methyltransferase